MYFEPEGQDNLSIEKFESMLKSNQILFFDSDEFEDIVSYYFENGKIPLARRAIKLGLEQHPDCTSLKIFKVEILLIEDKLEEAEQLVEDLFYIEQGSEDLYIQKATILSRKENHTEAINCLKKALELTDAPESVYYLLGMEYMFLDDFENALVYFAKCLNDMYDDYGILYNLICCYEYLDKIDEAIAFMNDFLDNNPYSAIGWQQIGRLYYKQKSYEKALAAYEFAIISDDRFFGAYMDKGKTLEKLKRWDEAIESYTITLSLEHPTSYALLRMGKCYAKSGKPEIALDFYLKCISEDPLLDKGWTAIVDFYYKSKNYEKALEYINEALAIDAENVLFWKRYAKINDKLKRYEEAEVGYSKALEYGNYELDSWISRGDILTSLGEYEAAIKNFQEALEFYPEHPEIEYRLSGLYFSLQENAKGEFHLRNALTSEPEFIMIVEELFPLVYRMKKFKQIVAQHTDTSI